MSVERLIDALNQLDVIHGTLIELADRKREALVRNDTTEVSGITNKETKLSREIEDLLREQTAATNEFFRAKGFQPTRAITVTELARMVTDLVQKEALLNARDRLAAKVAVLQKKNELNQQLIEQSLAIINYSIDLILGPDEEPIYRNPAAIPPNGLKRSGYFDSKA